MALEALVSLLAAVLALLMAGFVLDRREAESSRRFAALQVVLAAWLVGDYLARIATDTAGALLWARVALAALAFVGPAFVHFAVTFRARFAYTKHLWGAAAALAALAVATDFVVAGGAGIGFGLLVLVYYAFLQGTLLFALWRLVEFEAELKPSIDKQRALLMVVGAALVASLIPTVNILVPLAGFQLPWRLDALAAGASTLLIGYTFFMQRGLPAVKVVRR